MGEDQNRFHELITGLSVIFNVTVPEQAFDFYWRALSGYNDAQIEEAINRAAAQCRFMPKPAELIEFIEGDPETEGRIAYRRMIQLVQRIGPYESVLLDAPLAETIRLLGGWETVCDLEWNDLKFMEKEFVSIYRAMIERHRNSGPVKLSGFHERNNLAYGFPKHVPEVVDCTGKKLIEKLEERTSMENAPRVEDKQAEERLMDPKEVKRFVASLDRIGKSVPEADPEERQSPVLKGMEARRFEGDRRKAKEKAKRMGWGS